jgi:AraC-type DNA-binding domain-containing proteins
LNKIIDSIIQGVFDEREGSPEGRHPTYDSEMAFYNLVAEGKVENIDKRWSNQTRPDDKVRGVLSTNPLRNSMYHFVSMVTMITRVCINHGLDQDVAYKLSDYFIQKADKMGSPDEVISVQSEMVMTFNDIMRDRAKFKVKSKQVIKCIDYINENLHNTITVSELADYVGLNETYLSKVFKRETGVTVSEYVRDKKIEEACWLLKFTDKSSIEIATDLSFSSHSYFISVFKKVMNVTPKEYRNQSFRDGNRM